jgi:ATP-binding cassette subfamily B protein
MGFFSGLDAEKYDRKYSDRELARRIAVYFKPQVRRLLTLAVLTLAIAGAGSLLPILVSRGVGTLSQASSVWQSFAVGGAVLVIGLLIWFFNWIMRQVAAKTVADVVAALAIDAYSASVEHDLSFFDEFSTGKIVSRITADTRDFGELITLVADVVSQVVEALI